jgi:hypothetical protein
VLANSRELMVNSSTNELADRRANSLRFTGQPLIALVVDQHLETAI